MNERRNAVILASDANFLPPAKWLWLRLRELNPRSDTDVVLISPARLTEIGGQTVPAGASIASNELALPNLFFPTYTRISVATYWRLAMPRLLVSLYKRLLYIDIDVLPAQAALFDAFDYDMQGMPFSACRAPQHFGPGRMRGGKTTDGAFAFDKYFNGGVQLIDTSQFVGADLDNRTYDVIRREGAKLGSGDQTALNLASNGAWADLSPAFNFWPGALGTLMEGRFPPRILHYFGESKPWSWPTPYRDHPERRRLIAWLVRQREFAFLLRSFNGAQRGEGVRNRLLGRRSANAFINESNAALMRYLDSDFIGPPSTA